MQIKNLDPVTEEAGSQSAQGNPPCERDQARPQNRVCLSSKHSDHLLHHVNLLVLTEHHL